MMRIMEIHRGISERCFGLRLERIEEEGRGALSAMRGVERSLLYQMKRRTMSSRGQAEFSGEERE